MMCNVSLTRFYSKSVFAALNCFFFLFYFDALYIIHYKAPYSTLLGVMYFALATYVISMIDNVSCM